MLITLHKNARTTPAIRAEIAASSESTRALAKRFGVSELTIAKWRKRASVNDLPHTPHRLQTTLSPAQEAIVVELRKSLLLPLDDLVAVTKEFICPKASRSGLDRSLRRHGLSNPHKLKPIQPKSPHKPFKSYVPGYLHVDIKYLPQMADETARSYLFVAIDRATRWVFIQIMPSKSAANARKFLKALHKACPIKIKHILTEQVAKPNPPADLITSRGQKRRRVRPLTGKMWVSKKNITHPSHECTRFTALNERLKAKQAELFDHLTQDSSAAVTPALERLLHILDWVRLEHFIDDGCGQGRPPRDHFAIANAFMAKAVLGITTTVGLIDRLQVDKTLRRLCGFSPFKKLPNESTFSRVFAQLAEQRLLERVHAELITSQLGEQLIGHMSRDGTAICAREKPQKKMQTTVPAASSPESRKRGRPRAGEVVKTKPVTQIAMQMQQTAAVSLAQLPTACDRGSKCNAQGYKNGWNGYKLHMDTADCGVPISVALTSASVHDSQVAVPLSQISAQRVTSLYDVMDAAYCSEELRQHSRNLGHVPLIDHNPRNGTKRAFDACEAQRYKERTVAERMNARLKDEFGANRIYVRTHSKVMCHVMFGILALCADQIMRLLR